MQLKLLDGIPFVDVLITYQGQDMSVDHVLVDTGSASTLFAADVVRGVQIVPEDGDRLEVIFGVGGSEVVYSRRFDSIQAGSLVIPDFQIEIGGMDYHFPINGILGMDFLIQAGAVVDLADMRLVFKTQ